MTHHPSLAEGFIKLFYTSYKDKLELSKKLLLQYEID